MGVGVSRDKIQPSELQHIQKTDSVDSDDVRPKNRSSTDVCFLILYMLVLTVLICLLGYCFLHANIYRVINGYDDCGNICGNQNNMLPAKGCYGQNKINEPYHIMINTSQGINRLCIKNCNTYDGYKKFFNRCIPSKSQAVVNTVFSRTGLKNFFSEVSEDFQLCWTEICYLCLIALFFSGLLLLLFRFLVGFVVWIILIGSLGACIIGTVVLWCVSRLYGPQYGALWYPFFYFFRVLWKNSKDGIDGTPSALVPDIDARKSETYLAFAILATIATVVICLIIFVMRNRIKLVVQLFEEAGKAITAMPFLLLEPILTFIFLVIIISLWVYFCVVIESSGILSETSTNIYHYQKDGAMKFTRWYNFFVMLWMVQFAIGCQHMIIAGAVAVWYFKRDKSSLGYPVIQSAKNLIRYHLGSVALGSFLIATIQFVRFVLKIVEKYLKNREGKCIQCTLRCCQCCLYCFEKILKYITRNAYIEVAMYGYSFCKAGQQAFKLLSSNILRVAAINSVGDFVLFLGKAVVVIATVLIGVKMLQHKEGLQHMWVPLALSGLFAYFVAHCFMTVYEMAIDTIFLCFCEDCEKNDGETKPYFMSRGLMEFVENSKKALHIHDSREATANNGNKNIPTISENVARNLSG